MNDNELQRTCDAIERPGVISEIFQRVADRTKCLEHFEVSGDRISFKLSRSQLHSEIKFLKQSKIGSVVTLTEEPNQPEQLKQHFELRHLAIDDLHAPQIEQVVELANIIKESQSREQGIAVHCMAGIGRTSTMLVASHLLLGESLDSLLSQLRKRNPAFQLTGTQADFVRSVAEQVKKGQISI
jgi:protein-tyrosine phosphatase